VRALHPLSIHTAPQPGGSRSPMCFASKRALSPRTSARDSNRANSRHTCCRYLLGSAIRQLLSIAVATASCRSSVASCARWLAHSWAVGAGRDMLAVGARSCLSTHARAGSRLRLKLNEASGIFAARQSTMSSQRWVIPRVLASIPAMPLDSSMRIFWVSSHVLSFITTGSTRRSATTH
jgi:hypothetical protein